MWCCEYFDPAAAGTATAASAIGPTSDPRTLFEQLRIHCEKEEQHSHLIKGYRKTFCRLAAEWLAATSIDRAQHDEIVATVKAPSWRIWRPQLYVIPRYPIDSAGRLISVPRRARAAYGPELQIRDLDSSEFDIIEAVLR